MTSSNLKDRRAVTRRLLSAVLLALMAAGGALAGCGNDEQGATPETAADKSRSEESGAKPAKDPTGNIVDASSEPRDARVKIVMKDIAFKPTYLTARIGQTLVFTNEDEVAHKIKGVEGQYYTSKKLGNGQTFAYKIKKAPLDANMDYFTCTIHPVKMNGGVILTK